MAKDIGACAAMAALGLFFISASVHNRGKPPPSLTSPIYIACYGILAVVMAGGVWLLLSAHGSPLFGFLLATWPFTLYGMYRGERSRRLAEKQSKRAPRPLSAAFVTAYRVIWLTTGSRVATVGRHRRADRG